MEAGDVRCLPLLLATLFLLRQFILPNLEPTDRLDQLVNKPQDYLPPFQDLQTHHLTHFHVGSEDLSSDPHGYMADNLLTKPFLQTTKNRPIFFNH